MKRKCKDCSSPADKGILCLFHKEKYNKIQAEKRAYRRKNNLCIVCEKPVCEENKLYCTYHRRKNIESKKRKNKYVPGGLGVLLGTVYLETKKLSTIRRYIRKLLLDPNLILDFLNEKDILIINNRFVKNKKLIELEQELNLSQEWIRQLELFAAEKIKNYLISKRRYDNLIRYANGNKKTANSTTRRFKSN